MKRLHFTEPETELLFSVTLSPLLEEDRKRYSNNTPKIGKKSQRIRRAQQRKEATLPPWTGSIGPKAPQNTPEGRQNVSELRGKIPQVSVSVESRAAIGNFLPVTLRHLSLEKIREALRPKYSGDIRYRPQDPNQ
ncbi:hypothetical protein OUZ56_014264 [Daphnia magna]|uniref:Uncharacterized protein n=1 Tax=Daphnia magna TaxID=35525 RepID=A0ABR0AJ99_9CRUS|nr:hypothetical protein OUZ56_014264 [Daphnia magna]